MKPSISKNEVKSYLDFAVSKVIQNKDDFYDYVPAAASVNLVYPKEENIDWTASFWPGMLYISSEYLQDGSLDEIIENQMKSFERRLENNVELNTHDIGFLYTLTAGAEYRLKRSNRSKQMIKDAADKLMIRYHEKAGIIQAWGDLNNPDERGRMIIDCNMNLPLLYLASQITGDVKYFNAAYSHVKQASKYIVRDNYSTYHTFYMDVETGEPKFGKTAQGYSDNSCWARGQAWGIYGFTLSYRYTGDESLLQVASHLANYFLDHLPEDKICYWDLDFTSGPEERDSSAAAIAACGLLALSKELPETNEKKRYYAEEAIEIVRSLGKNYTTKNESSNGILMHAVYAKPDGKGIDECNIWGDYFYMEALISLYKSWFPYW